ncbi:cysteine desulfurase [Ignavibacteria bacterium]|nr:cysteine desulfurase [Bacteroidota bacterium]MCZ2133570.1 cysteine desulfurase [Bacteroidota bacterium]
MIVKTEIPRQPEPIHAPDWSAVRRDFPALAVEVYGKPLAYLDNAATAHKPQSVIDAIVRHYTESNANIHRGSHYLSQKATDEYENARKTVAQFIGASDREIIFTRGATESVNLAAATFGRRFLDTGDEIVVSEMEHHSNIVPWQMLCKEKGAKLRIIPVSDSGELITDNLEAFLGNRTKLVALTHVSNSLGTINPVREIVAAARERGIATLLDGAQAVPHLPVNIRELGCDFYAFSGHKLYAPSGIGVLFVSKRLIDELPPYQTGGGMIRRVTLERSTFDDAPGRFEAGTPNIEGAIGLAAAIEYVQFIGISHIAAREQELLGYANKKLADVPGLKIYGEATEKASVISFTLGDIHPHDVGSFLDREGVAARAGHHCNQPLWSRFGVPATTRASMAFYNTESEIDALVEGLQAAVSFFS